MSKKFEKKNETIEQTAEAPVKLSEDELDAVVGGAEFRATSGGPQIGGPVTQINLGALANLWTTGD